MTPDKITLLQNAINDIFLESFVLCFLYNYEWKKFGLMTIPTLICL